MSGAAPVGTTKGPGESPHTYTLVAPDADDQLKIGEFVAYDARVDGELRSVLGRIDARRPLKLYPDAFMADPRVPPSRVAELVGFDHATPELYEFDVAVLGYFDDALGFVNPRVAPRAGRPVYLVPDDDLAHALSRVPHGQSGAAHVGSLLTRARDRVPITLDVNEFASTHLAIIAGTGAGKSYLAGVIVEELMQPSVGAAVVIVDPHGEYGTLEEIANHPGFRGDGYRARTLVVRPEQIKIRRDLLHPSDIYQLVGTTHGLSGPQREVLRLALRAVGIDRGRRWTYRQLTEAVNDVELSGDPRSADDEGGDYTLVRRALMWRLNATLGRQDGIFDDYEHTSLQELIRPGQCTVLQLNEVPREEQQIIAATLLRRSFDGRVGHRQGAHRRGRRATPPGAGVHPHRGSPPLRASRRGGAHHQPAQADPGRGPKVRVCRGIDLAASRQARPGRAEPMHDPVHPARGESRRSAGHCRRGRERRTRAAGRAAGAQQRSGNRGGRGGKHDGAVSRACAAHAPRR